LAGGIARRLVEVHNDAVAGVGRIDGEVSDAGDLFVRAGAAERLAAGIRLPLQHAELDQFGAGRHRKGAKDDGEQRQEAGVTGWHGGTLSEEATGGRLATSHVDLFPSLPRMGKRGGGT